MKEALRKKYIPMTETIYYTLLSVTSPRHGYAIMQYVSSLTQGRILLGTGTLYTMVGRLAADGVIEAVPEDGRKVYRITDAGLGLLREETGRLALQLEDGWSVLNMGGTAAEEPNSENRGGYIGKRGKAVRFLHIAPDLSQPAAAVCPGARLRRMAVSSDSPRGMAAQETEGGKGIGNK